VVIKPCGYPVEQTLAELELLPRVLPWASWPGARWPGGDRLGGVLLGGRRGVVEMPVVGDADGQTLLEGLARGGLVLGRPPFPYDPPLEPPQAVVGRPLPGSFSASGRSGAVSCWQTWRSCWLASRTRTTMVRATSSPTRRRNSLVSVSTTMPGMPGGYSKGHNSLTAVVLRRLISDPGSARG
jgi:hypothetical protein